METSTYAETQQPVAAASVNLDKCMLYYLATGTCFGSVLILTGLIGNGFTLVIMGRDRKKSSTINCLFWLALSDTLVLVTDAFLLLPAGARKLLNGFFSDVNYNIVTNLYVAEPAYIFNQVSTLLTVLVTFQRYVAVCLPHKAKEMCTVRMVNRSTLLFYILSTIYYCPRFFVRKLAIGANGLFTVEMQRMVIDNPAYSVFYLSILTTLVSYVIPLIALIFMSVKILVAMKKNVIKKNKDKEQVRKDLTISSLAIVAVFVVCQVTVFFARLSPMIYVPYVQSLQCGGDLQWFFFVPQLSMAINSSANFFIYIIFTKGFRGKLKGIITRKTQIQPLSREGTCSTRS